MLVNKILIEKLLYPAMEKGKGNRVRTYLGELERTQYAAQTRLRAIQEARLKRLLHVCIADVPAYQTLGITPEEIERDPWTVFHTIREPLIK